MTFTLLTTLLLASAIHIPIINAAPSTGCNKPLPQDQVPGGESYLIPDFRTTNGTTRSYLIHIPSNYKIGTPTPLIFSFHGHGKDAAGQEKLSQFSNETVGWNPGAFAVYPNGLPVCPLFPHAFPFLKKIK